MRILDPEHEIKIISQFIKEKIHNAGFKKAIVGLSGGIDSALTASLCVSALGSENVIGLMLPYKNSHPDSLAHATVLAELLEINYQVIDISPMVDIYFKEYATEADMLRRGNYMARIRMCTLFDQSSKHQALVAGTSNKSELYVGYCTQYGDSACAFEPIGHLYKTEVRELSKFMGVPKEILRKPPTADLWAGQTDEDELGITYATLDEILYNMIDLKKDKELLSGYIDTKYVELVDKKIKASAFKRKLPDTLEAVWE